MKYRQCPTVQEFPHQQLKGQTYTEQKQTWPFHTEASAARSTSEPQKTEPGVSRSVDFAPSPQYLDALVIPQTVVEELG